MNQEITAVTALILNGKLSKASEALADFTPKALHEERMKAHYEAVIELHRGNVTQSFRMMQSAQSRFGDNVNLSRDLAICHYRLQDMQGFRESLARLEAQLNQFESQLCAQSLIECELMLGKLLEEEGRLVPALQYYERALKRSEQAPHRWRALVQKARWMALYQPLPALSELYRELISIDLERVNQDLRIELDHSLMLIELRLIGADHAWQRVERMMASGGDEIDQRLFVFDYIEGCLNQEHELSRRVLEKANEYADLDPFESFLKSLVQRTLDPPSLLHQLASLAPKLPWASHLKLICVAANLERNAGVRQELHRKIQLIIRALDQKSQALWTDRLRQSLQTQEVRIDFSARHRSVNIHGKVLDLSKKKIGLQLLEKLVSSPVITVDDAIQWLWQTEFTPEHYHRLRMSVHRLNTLIHETTGAGKVVEVDSQNVRLRPEVRLRPAPSDEGFDLGLMGV